MQGYDDFKLEKLFSERNGILCVLLKLAEKIRFIVRDLCHIMFREREVEKIRNMAEYQC